MIRRSIQPEQTPQQRDDLVAQLRGRLRDGIEALNDPQIEAKVRSYFERHPNYSCDMIHVAAVACGFKAAKDRAMALAPSTAERTSQRV